MSDKMEMLSIDELQNLTEEGGRRSNALEEVADNCCNLATNGQVGQTFRTHWKPKATSMGTATQTLRPVRHLLRRVLNNPSLDFDVRLLANAEGEKGIYVVRTA